MSPLACAHLLPLAAATSKRLAKPAPNDALLPMTRVCRYKSNPPKCMQVSAHTHPRAYIAACMLMVHGCFLIAAGCSHTCCWIGTQASGLHDGGRRRAWCLQIEVGPLPKPTYYKELVYPKQERNISINSRPITTPEVSAGMQGPPGDGGSGGPCRAPGRSCGTTLRCILHPRMHWCTRGRAVSYSIRRPWQRCEPSCVAPDICTARVCAMPDAVRRL